MKHSFKLIPIKKLKSHENINKNHLSEIIYKLRKERVLRNPIIVEKNHLVILDGHHRVNAFKKLGLKYIPASLISYNQVRVYLRRKLDIKDIKSEVIRRGINNNPFPSKTTRHLIKSRLRNINYSLNSLL